MKALSSMKAHFSVKYLNAIPFMGQVNQHRAIKANFPHVCGFLRSCQLFSVRIGVIFFRPKLDRYWHFIKASILETKAFSVQMAVLAESLNLSGFVGLSWLMWTFLSYQKVHYISLIIAVWENIGLIKPDWQNDLILEMWNNTFRAQRGEKYNHNKKMTKLTGFVGNLKFC